VSFASPLVLLALLAIPVLALLYVRAERGRRAAAAAFASPALQASVAPRRPGWRRHAPLAAIALALAALIVAAARPERTVAVPIERASIMLVTDVSGSMKATDVKPNRLTAAKRAAADFVSSVPGKVNIGVMEYGTATRVLQSPTTDRAAVSSALRRLSVGGSTATGDAIAAAASALQRVPAGIAGKRPPAAIVLLSDGASDKGRDPVAAAQAAGRLKIPVYTVALGTATGTVPGPAPGGGTRAIPVPPDPRALAQIARASGGETFTADTAGGLKAVYERLGSQLGHKKEKRQVTSAVAGGGLLLLLGGAAMSLGFFGRIV
jgi:Ca-activated chloride channel family protein